MRSAAAAVLTAELVASGGSADAPAEAMMAAEAEALVRGWEEQAAAGKQKALALEKRRAEMLARLRMEHHLARISAAAEGCCGWASLHGSSGRSRQRRQNGGADQANSGDTWRCMRMTGGR
eukprot:COSAG01_NODE_12183_length_1781_cov_1.703440_2_plen_121_part_00